MGETATLRLTIDFPGFYVDGSESSEDLEEAMALASEQVVVVFAAFEGEQRVLQHLDGHIRRFALAGSVGGASEDVSK